MAKLDREQAIALAALFLVLLSCTIAPALSLKARSDALQALADERDMLQRLELAHRRSGRKAGAHEQASVAPATAFLNAPTSGLASAQLEAYLSRLAMAQQASLISSGVQQTNRSDTPDMVRVQATLDITYAALQRLLFKLETGTPYVFVDSMILQTAGAMTQHVAHAPTMEVTLNLRAIWRKSPV